MPVVRRILRWLLLLLLLALLSVAGGLTTAAAADDGRVEAVINRHLEGMHQRAARGEMTAGDRVVLHAGILSGALVAPFLSPEGYAVLWRAAYGDGRPLRLSSRYFSRSPYLARQVEELGVGHHGPLWVRQEDDWRLSLTFNPYFLTITDETVRISHPTMRFQKPGERPTYTVVPVGRMRIEVPDNLVGALQGETFPAYAEWPRSRR